MEGDHVPKTKKQTKTTTKKKIKNQKPTKINSDECFQCKYVPHNVWGSFT
jgi:hypothetical protein